MAIRAKRVAGAAVAALAIFAVFWNAHSESGNPPVLTPEPGGFTVATLNLAMEKDSRTILRDLAAAPDVRDADVLLFQEAVHSSAQKLGVAGEVARALNRKVAFSPAGPGVYDRGLAVLSRYPIRDIRVRQLARFDLHFHNRDRFALAATVDTPAGPVRVWNVHLDTRVNAPERLQQLEPVAAEAAAVPGPKIIAGDFNTNDFYWLWNVVPVPSPGRQAGAVRAFMSAREFHAPLQEDRFTFNFPRMHLDWIYEQGLTARAVSVRKIPFSDHRAVVAAFSGQSPASLRATAGNRLASAKARRGNNAPLHVGVSGLGDYRRNIRVRYGSFGFCGNR